jgi:uncharacterized membrane protein (UPF0127 family)
MNTFRFDFLSAPRFLAVLLTFAALPALADTQAATTTTLKIGAHRLKVEVAQTDAQREKGLMFRKQLGRDDGMLFIFDEPAYHAMWMKNTLIPLSVAFIDDAGRIVNVEDMQPQTEDSHCASRPARYALEMNLGWFSAKGIKPGTRIGGIPGVK